MRAQIKPAAHAIHLVPHQATVTVIGGHSAVTSTIDGAASWRAAGNRILFIGHFKSQAQARAIQDTLESLTDQAIWIFDQGPALILKRKQDRCFVYGVAEFLDACAETDGAHTAWVAESDCILLMDQSSTMQGFSTALQTRLKPELKPNLLAWCPSNA